MKMKFAFLMLLAASVFSLTAKENVINPGIGKPSPVIKKIPGTPTITNMIVDETLIGGTITVVDDQDLGTLTVTYQTNGYWKLKNVRLYVGTATGIPVGCSGNARPTNFQYQKSNMASGTTTYTFTIPLAGLPTDAITIAAQATVYHGTGCHIEIEKAWGQGAMINDGGDWAMKFVHVLEIR